MSYKVQAVHRLSTDILQFSKFGGGLRLRSYQQEVAQAIVDSVINRRGLSFVVMFPRQSGKNELQAQIEAFLLMRYSRTGGEMVKVSPTWKPQSLNAMNRLERALSHNILTRKLWHKEWGYIYRVGKATLAFLSGASRSNIVGATASLLLEVDEAQDVDILKYDKEVAPMAAASNAVRVFWGTAWTSETLLAREMALIERQLRVRRGARDLGTEGTAVQRTGGGEKDRSEDEPQRIFKLTAEAVRLEAPEYGVFVDDQVERLGRDHPMVRSQFFSETIEAQSQLFPPARQGMMQGRHPAETEPVEGMVYALLADVGGAALTLPSPMSGRGFKDPAPDKDEHDASVVTAVRLRYPAEGGPPIYEVVQRYRWVGLSQAKLYERVKALVEHWRAWRVVVDATGLGAGLASFLAQKYPSRVRPFLFTLQSKSQLGWDFIALVETGRYKEYSTLIPDPSPKVGRREAAGDGPMTSLRSVQVGGLQAMFWREVRACEGEVVPGPGQVLRWEVPDGRKDPESGERVHDDLLVSAALCGIERKSGHKKCPDRVD